MRIKQMIIHSNLSKMKNKILPTCIHGNYGDSLGEFDNMSDGVFRDEKVKDIVVHLQHWVTAADTVMSRYSRYMLCVPLRES